MKLREVPLRCTTGAYILHAGWEKWHADEERAQALHAMATTAYPAVKRLPPTEFTRLLAAGEMATGSALLLPLVPTATAGLVLSAFAGGLLGLYARVPGMRREGSVWPTPQGTAVSKDVWMLGIGLGLVLDGAGRRLAASRLRRRAA
ncbi:MAG TPA: hypothetical protein VMB72_04800 [Acidimicrobiales bacterium]|nr:hypothetical protein [Acidimicrobiales bacterium]